MLSSTAAFAEFCDKVSWFENAFYGWLLGLGFVLGPFALLLLRSISADRVAVGTVGLLSFTFLVTLLGTFPWIPQTRSSTA